MEGGWQRATYVIRDTTGVTSIQSSAGCVTTCGSPLSPASNYARDRGALGSLFAGESFLASLALALGLYAYYGNSQAPARNPGAGNTPGRAARPDTRTVSQVSKCQAGIYFSCFPFLDVLGGGKRA